MSEYELIVSLTEALERAIEEADGWFDESRGAGECPGLDTERRLLEQTKKRMGEAEMKPDDSKNFCRVFEMPEAYPKGYCFGGGKTVQMIMVDWFQPWPPDDFEVKCDTWPEVVEILRPWVMKKNYVKPGRRYVLVTEFGEALVFDGEET